MAQRKTKTKAKQRRKNKSFPFAFILGLLALINFCAALALVKGDIDKVFDPSGSTPLESEANIATLAPSKQKRLPNTNRQQIKRVNNKDTPSVSTTQAFDTPNFVSIIIDDVGYRYKEGMRTLALNKNITAAILPFTPYTQDLAHHAQINGVEVMLHAPMEPDHKKHWGQGLHSKMGKRQLSRKLAVMLKDIPQAKGINNHMGSSLTQSRKRMNWLMGQIREKNLYFIDSVTTPYSTAYDAALAHEIPTYKRDVFLDNDTSFAAIDFQFKRLIAIAQTQGHAVAIGHPHIETLKYLERHLPTLKYHGIELIPISVFLQRISS